MFPYPSLDVGTQAFRLLELLPGPRTASLECVLSQHSLNTAPSYEALSYVWGEPTMNLSMKLNEQPFLITQSLYKALLYLRHPRHERTIWIDAVCINQANDAERSEQVRFMAKTYRNAAQVIVWLGEEADDSNLAIGVLEELVRAVKDGEARFFSSRELAAFEALFRRRWWGRVWVIQEVAVAKEVLVTCGTKSISWKALEIALSAINKFDGQEWIQGLRGWGYGSDITHLRNRYDRLALLDILSTVKTSDASDGRDKVYAVLGLTKLDWIKPDYSKSVSHVYIDVVQTIISRTGNLDILGFTYPWSQFIEMPSWVPDWSQTTVDRYSNQRFISRPSSISIYAASGLSNVQARISDDLKILTLKGFRCGIIESLSPRFEYDKLSDHRAIAQTKTLKEWETAALAIPSTGCPYVERGGRQEAFWRTLIADADWKGHRAGPQEYKCFLAWTARSTVLDTTTEIDAPVMRPKWEAMKTFLRSVYDSLGSRTLFISDTGHMGLVPSWAEPGDLICIVFGGAVPFILRKQDSNYILIGECFCHGLMDGEAMKDFDSGLTQDEEFCLI